MYTVKLKWLRVPPQLNAIVIVAGPCSGRSLIGLGIDLPFQEARRAFDLASNEFSAGALSNLDLLTAEQTVVAADSAIAVSDAAVVQDQIAVFKALGGGWQDPP